MLQIMMINVSVGVQTNPANGDKIVEIVDPANGISVAVPMSAEVARQLGLSLTSSVAIAPGPLPKKNGNIH